MRVFRCCLFVMAVGCLQASAQLQNANWYFGNGAGISFVSGSPVAVGGGQTYSIEGCSTISDQSGNLLFYTDGSSVFNANHQQMPNGIGLNGGYGSSSQAALIVPDPANTNLYYVFTVDEGNGSFGLSYSKVDMTLQSGLGDVTILNNLLVTPTDEKLTGVVNATGDGYWVVARGVTGASNNYYAYPVTASGIGAVVTSSVGSTGGLFAGQMRISPTGNKIAHTLYYDSAVELSDFDNATGIISNPITIPLVGDNNGDYGVEFSASGNVLYCETAGAAPSNLFQINVNAGSTAAIIASVNMIATFDYDYGTLYRAIDNKIYWAHYSQPYIGCINDPEVLGSGCNYIDNAVTLSSGAYSQHGMQNGIPFLSALSLPVAGFTSSQNICVNDCIIFNNQSTNGTLYQWMFSGATPGTSTSVNPTVCYDTSGFYNVTLIATNSIGSDTLTQINYITVNSITAPLLASSHDTSICNGQSFTLNATNPSSTYLWSTGATTSTLNVSTQDDYAVTVTDANGCTAADTLTLLILSSPDVQLADAVLCKDSTLVLSAPGGLTAYLWQNGATASSITINTPGNYSVTVTNTDGCTASDNAAVANVNPSFELGDDIEICTDQQATLNPGSQFDTYNWSNGETASSITVNQNGWYVVTVTLQGCPAYDSVQITVFTYPVVNLGSDTSLCHGNSVLLNSGNENFSHQWSTLSNASSISVTQSGLYSVTVTNAVCNTSDSITVTFIDCKLIFPTAFSPNLDGLNDVFRPWFVFEPAAFEFKVYNRWGQQIYSTTNPTLGWDGTFNGQTCELGVYVWTCTYSYLSGPQNLGGSVTLIK